MTTFLQQLVNGVSLGSIYALIALGYTMVYGVLRLINFAHSEIFMIGSFAALGALILAGAGAAWTMEHQGHYVTGMSNRIVWGMPHVFAVFLIVVLEGAVRKWVASSATLPMKATGCSPITTAFAAGVLAALELTASFPKTVLEKVNKEGADKAKAALEGAGATVTVK